MLVASVASPAKLARTAPVKVRRVKPARLTPGNVATPFASVVADPTGVTVVPLVSVNATISPARGTPPAVRVAVRLAVPA